MSELQTFLVLWTFYKIQRYELNISIQEDLNDWNTTSLKSVQEIIFLNEKVNELEKSFKSYIHYPEKEQHVLFLGKKTDEVAKLMARTNEVIEKNDIQLFSYLIDIIPTYLQDWNSIFNKANLDPI